MKEIESIKECGGYLNRYTHESDSCCCEMTFSVYLPPQAKQAPVPSLYWLSGLTCSDDNARTKGGFQRFAAQQGIAIVFPDTARAVPMSPMSPSVTTWVRPRDFMSTRRRPRGQRIIECTTM